MAFQKYSRRYFSQLVTYVPKHTPPTEYEKQEFNDYLNSYDNIVVLTGAGISTESGIPDYRSEKVGIFNRTTYKPLSSDDFLKSNEKRVRYWARNFMNWPNFSGKTPNPAHISLTRYECLFNKITTIITQNIDGLHHKAGSRNIVELHGNAFWVQCMKCMHIVCRYDFQNILQQYNPTIQLQRNIEELKARPDGDLEIEEEIYDNFKVPNCEKCCGIMKPTIIFHGDNVSKYNVNIVEKAIENCDSLLVMGTSLSTLSSYRIVQQAYDLCKLIMIVNIGPTRGDKLADMKINARCSEIFPVYEKTEF